MISHKVPTIIFTTIFTTILLAFLMSPLVHADLTDIVIDHSPKNVDHPRMAADGNGHVYVVWEDTRNGNSDIYFNYSSDYGATWLTSDIRLDKDTPGAGDSNYPQIACDSNRHVYVVWEDERNGSADIYYNYSSDYGATWQSTDKKLSSIAYAPPPQFPRIACDNSGHVYVAWDNNYFNTSSDYGVTWLTQAVRISTSGGNGTQLFCDQNGHVYVAWITSEVLFNYSSDYGNTWQSIDRIVSNAGAIPYGLSMSADQSGHIYCSWHDGRNSQNSPDVYFNSASDYGNTWEASDTMLSTGTPGATYSIWPKVTSDETGHIYVAWYDRRNGLGDIYMNSSSDHGTTWRNPDVRLDTDSAGSADSGFPEIAGDSYGDVYVIWTDNQVGIGSGLYMNLSLDNGINWLSTNKMIGSSGFHPQIITDDMRLYVVRSNSNIVLNVIDPFTPNHPSPANGTTQIGLTPTLQWLGGDLNLDLFYDVYFGTSSLPTQLVSSNQTGTTYLVTETLDRLTTYYWQIVTKENSGAEIPGPIWFFTTVSNPPQFVDFSPADAAEDVTTLPTLIWHVTDLDPGDTCTFDIYFGDTNPPALIVTDFPLNTYDSAKLSSLTTYYWKIVARDSHGSETEGPLLHFTTTNNPPQFITSSYSPDDGAIGVGLTPTLKWSAVDLDPGDTVSYDIYFGTTSPPPLILSNQTVTKYQPGTLYHMTAYFWKVVAKDNKGAVTESPIMSLTTLDHAPKLGSNGFSPANGKTGISFTPTLTWSASDVDPDDTLTYDVYFGTSSPPPLVAASLTTMSYQPGQLSPETQYYWMVVARDPHGVETSGPILSFFTWKYPRFNSFSPVDGATGVSPVTTLSWSAYDPDVGDTITYDVYFGESLPPPLIVSSQATTYNPGTLKAMTTYYWKVVARDNHGLEVESSQSFTTCSRPPQLSKFSPLAGSTTVSLTPVLSWTASDPDPGDTLTYDVYFGTSSPPPLVVSNQTAASYQPGTLLPMTAYYWKVVARDNHGVETSGPVLVFQTGYQPFIQSVAPNPVSTKQIVSLSGLRFGNMQGTSILHLGSKKFRFGNKKIQFWSNTEIDLKIPAFLAWLPGTTQTLDLWVTVNGVDSNKIQLTIKRQ